MTAREARYPVKLSYRRLDQTVATMYSDDLYPLDFNPADGQVVIGTDKATDEPVAAAWSDAAERWTQLAGEGIE